MSVWLQTFMKWNSEFQPLCQAGSQNLAQSGQMILQTYALWLIINQ